MRVTVNEGPIFQDLRATSFFSTVFDVRMLSLRSHPY